MAMRSFFLLPWIFSFFLFLSELSEGFTTISSQVVARSAVRRFATTAIALQKFGFNETPLTTTTITKPKTSTRTTSRGLPPILEFLDVKRDLIAIRSNIKSILDVNGDGKINHQDVGAALSIVLLAWMLSASPALAKGGGRGSHGGGSHGSRAISSRSSGGNGRRSSTSSRRGGSSARRSSTSSRRSSGSSRSSVSRISTGTSSSTSPQNIPLHTAAEVPSTGGTVALTQQQVKEMTPKSIVGTNSIQGIHASIGKNLGQQHTRRSSSAAKPLRQAKPHSRRSTTTLKSSRNSDTFRRGRTHNKAKTGAQRRQVYPDTRGSETYYSRVDSVGNSQIYSSDNPRQYVDRTSGRTCSGISPYNECNPSNYPTRQSASIYNPSGPINPVECTNLPETGTVLYYTDSKTHEAFQGVVSQSDKATCQIVVSPTRTNMERLATAKKQIKAETMPTTVTSTKVPLP